MHRAWILGVAVALAIAACGSKQGTGTTKEPSSAPVEQPVSEEPQPGAGAALTAEQCAAAGGQVVGDIGDGAIHRPEYRCPTSGEPPLGPIAPEPGGPIAIEGAVCCK